MGEGHGGSRKHDEAAEVNGGREEGSQDPDVDEGEGEGHGGAGGGQGDLGEASTSRCDQPFLGPGLVPYQRDRLLRGGG